MSGRDALKIKEQIIEIFKRRGPSLPVHIAKETELSILFASAFLSELISDKRVKISVMKVGSSPLYFIPGQEHMLESFSEHLKSKDREAFILLREKRFIKDSEQEPAIRVALRTIRDFAIPFKIDDDFYWRYFTANESEFIEKRFKETDKPKVFHKVQIIERQAEIIGEVKKEILPEKVENSPPELLEIKEIPEKKQERKTLSKGQKKAPQKKRDDKFFNRVKEFLDGKNAEIAEIISAGQSELVLKIKIDRKEKILVAYKKKKISEKDIVNAHKKSQKYDLPFLITSNGEMPKKLTELIDAIRVLSEVEKIK